MKQWVKIHLIEIINSLTTTMSNIITDESEIKRICAVLDEFIRLLEQYKTEANQKYIEELKSDARDIQSEVRTGSMPRARGKRKWETLRRKTVSLLKQIGINIISQLVYEGAKLLF